MAAPYGPDGQRAADTFEGLRLHTHPAIDKYSTGLAVMEFMCGRLPAAVDRTCYREEQWPEFLAAVHDFDWASCEQMAALPAEAQDLLCSLLARNPEQRPQSAVEALQHPWLTGANSGEPDAVALVAEAADEAAPAWAAAHEELGRILGCDDDVLQRVLAITTAPEAAAVSSPSGTGSCKATSSSEACSSSKAYCSNSSNNIDASCCLSSSSSSSAVLPMSCACDASCGSDPQC
jgi:serine/threonine protein kinase